MLAEFLETNHDELVERCKAKVAKRAVPRPATAEPEFGIPLLLGQLVSELRAEQSAVPGAQPGKLPPNIGSTAGKHGNEAFVRNRRPDDRFVRPSMSAGASARGARGSVRAAL